MSSRIGRMLSVQIFGESHGAEVGVTLDGLPAGLKLDVEEAQRLLDRRAARNSAIATPRRESDIPRIISGLKDGVTTGQPLTALFENANTHSSDYSFLPDCPRPGHADYPATVRSAGHDDLRGSGHHSGRLTLPFVFAGSVAMQLLAREGVRVAARVTRIGQVEDATPIDPVQPNMDALARCRAQAIPALDSAAGERMYEAIVAARAAGDSLGGEVECVASGLPTGLGAPFYEGAEAVLAAQLFSIPAVKAVAFGEGFAAAGMRGSEYNDPYAMSDGRVVTLSNHAGGLLGGITNGMPVIVRAAFRPTPSISLEQRTVRLSEGENTALAVRGRHDPCVAVRAVPVVESAVALALCELWLERRASMPLAGE